MFSGCEWMFQNRLVDSNSTVQLRDEGQSGGQSGYLDTDGSLQVHEGGGSIRSVAAVLRVLGRLERF